MKLARPVRLLLITVFVVLALALTGFVVIVPAPIDALAWTPLDAPAMTGALAPNDLLRDAEMVGRGEFASPEDVAFDAEGRLYTGNSDGRINRITFSSDGAYTIDVFADDDGQPLDMRFDAAGNLIVADWRHGLVSYTPDGQMTVLLPLETMIEGEPFRRPDGVAIASDGTIYVTIGSLREGEQYRSLEEVLEQRPYGRLIAYQPEIGEARMLLRELYFGNGVALAPDESYLLVADQYRYRIIRYWLNGERAGTHEFFAENLPGFVHNLHFSPDGERLWAAIYAQRVPFLDQIHPQPFLKNQLSKLPEAWVTGSAGVSQREDAPGVGMAIEFDLEGNILRSLQNPPPNVYTLSAAHEHAGFLYLVGLDADTVLRYQLN
jgi:sugar lactone lactonase YvrE